VQEKIQTDSAKSAIGSDQSDSLSRKGGGGNTEIVPGIWGRDNMIEMLFTKKLTPQELDY